MLTPWDDLPVHQVATTLDHAGTSDPRFFDRYWFIVYDRDARVALASGMGFYRNTGVVDGFACTMVDGTQRNHRYSRALRPDFSLSVGPLAYTVEEGLRRFRLVHDADASGTACNLTWVASMNAFEEDHHFSRQSGMTHQDYRRYYQFGTASGSITVDGVTYESDDFWTFRDRSFGVRPGMGGPMPRTAPTAAPTGEAVAGMGLRGRPALALGGSFGTTDLFGVVNFAETADGELIQLDGRIVRGEGAPERVTRIEHELTFYRNGAFRSGTFHLNTGSGDSVTIEMDPLTAPFVYVGFGYLDGYDDRLGPGAYRGAAVAQRDIYDVRDPGEPIDRSGTRDLAGEATSRVMDHALRVIVNGAPGYMEAVGGLQSRHDRYGPSS
jgi:hypothetical protein